MDNIQDALTLIYLLQCTTKIGNTKNMYPSRTYVQKFQSLPQRRYYFCTKGASEFIDFDIPSVLKYGARYVVMTLLSYTDQPYKDLPECFTGWMVRQYPGSGETFEPSTVQDKVDITADTQISIPVILDLKERKLIWTDLSLTRDLTYDNTIEANQKGMILVGKALTNLVKPNLYDLFRLHIEARGELVQDIEEAESIFLWIKGLLLSILKK